MKTIVAAPSGYFLVSVPKGMGIEGDDDDGGFIHDPIIAFLIEVDDEENPVYFKPMVDTNVTPISVHGVGYEGWDTVYVIRGPDMKYYFGDRLFLDIKSVVAAVESGDLTPPNRP